jgi:hypothetical protein
MYGKTENRYAVHHTGCKVNGEGFTEVNARFASLLHTVYRAPRTLHRVPCTAHRVPCTGAALAVSPPLVSCTEQVTKATVWLHSL